MGMVMKSWILAWILLLHTLCSISLQHRKASVKHLLEKSLLVPIGCGKPYRAVEAGPGGPAAAGPIFGQLTRAKMPYELGGLFN